MSYIMNLIIIKPHLETNYNLLKTKIASIVIQLRPCMIYVIKLCHFMIL